MGKVHPLTSTSIDSSSAATSRRESFTIWMKSLLMQANGCTVYNQKGEIVYRIDNYDHKNSNEVYLMDLQGKVLFTILRKVINLNESVNIFTTTFERKRLNLFSICY